MRNDEYRSALHEFIHTVLHDGFRTRIDGARRLVEDHDGRVCNRRAGDREELTLTLREVRAVLIDHRVIPFGQAGDEVVRADELRRRDALFVRRVQLAVADIAHNGIGEQVGILQHHAERTAEFGLPDLVDIDAVVTDLAVRNVVEAGQKVGDGRLARARCADERDLLPGTGVQADVVQDDLLGNVAEIHVEEAHVAFELGIGDGTVRRVRVFPRPDSRALLALDELAVLFPCVDEGDVAFVRLGFFVDERNDALRARDTHDDGVDLIGNLTDVVGELTGRLQEGDDERGSEREKIADPERSPDADVADFVHRERRADKRDDNVHDVADIRDDGHEHIGVTVRLIRHFKVRAVDLIEPLLRLFLVTEHLDDLLPLHHLFDEAFRLCDRPLCGKEESARSAADEFCNKHDRHDPDQNDERKVEARIQHEADKRNAHDPRDHELRDTLRDHLAQRIDVVCVIAHDVAVVVRIEVTDGQILHPVEHLLAHIAQIALRDDRHELGIYRARDQGYGVHSDQDAHQPRYFAGDLSPRLPVCDRSLQQVEQRKHDECGKRRDDRIDDDTRQRDGQHDGVVMEKRLDKTLHNALLYGRAIPCTRLTHAFHLPLRLRSARRRALRQGSL